MADPGWLEADWPAPPGVRAGTVLRCADGVSAPPFGPMNLGAHCGDDPAAVRENRHRLRPWLRLPGEPAWLKQVHGTAVARIGPADFEAPPEADAAVTDLPGRVLAILSADCLPVVFATRDGAEIAAAHAGWRGLAAGVLEATVAAMRAPPDQVLAWLGPAAGPERYEVGDEVRKAFVAADPAAAAAFVPTRPGHWRMDLFALARRRLARAGLAEVHGGGQCTISDEARFHSHRRDGRGGRLATLVWKD